MSERCHYSYEIRSLLINSLIRMAREHEVVLNRFDKVSEGDLYLAKSCGVRLIG